MPQFGKPPSLAVVVASVAAAAVLALVVAAIMHVVVGRLARRSTLPAELSKRARRPSVLTLVLAAMYGTLHSFHDIGPWQRPVEHILVIALIGAVAWLAAAMSMVVEDAALARYRVDVQDNQRARRIRTQVMVVRRVTVAMIAVVAIGATLLTFPGARTAGTSLLASAGLLGVVAGLAAQSTLSNLFAGLQIAFSDWLRLDDVVVVEGEWGRIEDITLSYVVVHVWDDRRLIFPTSYFTTTPFQNWTRSGSAILGTVFFDVDWGVPVAAMREQLRRIVEQTDLWDGRVCVLQVTDAVNGWVQVRVLVSTVDAPTNWDLRCHVRERLVGWLQESEPRALPRLRVDPRPARAPLVPQPAPDGRREENANVFSGNAESQARGAQFSPPTDEPPASTGGSR